MKHNEIMEKTTLHKKDSDGSRKFLFFAALAAAVAAIAGALYGVFRLGKKRGAAEEAERTEKLRAERAKRRAEIRRAQRAAAARPVYVVHPLQPKKPESGAKRFRRRLCASVAAILVISMVGSSTMPYIEPSTVLAKESFSGIGKIVEEHGDEPYRILDIVAADATYTDPAAAAGTSLSYTFNLGTMGYLVNGQSDLQEDLAKIFEADLAKATPSFATSGDRKSLFEAVTGGASLPFGLTYEETYGGIGGMSTAGYTQIYPLSATAESISAPADGDGGFSLLVENGPTELDNEPTGDTGSTGDGENDSTTGTPKEENNGDNTTGTPEGDSNGDGTTGTPEGDSNGDGMTGTPEGESNGDGMTGTPEGEDNGDGTTGTPEEENNGGGNINSYGQLPIATSGETEITGTFTGRSDFVEKGNGDYEKVTGVTPGSLPGIYIGPVPQQSNTYSTMSGSASAPSQIYTYGEGAPLRVTFKAVGPAVEGGPGGYVAYEPLPVGTTDGERTEYATDMTGVYWYDEESGKYSYVNTLANILGRQYQLSGGTQESEKQEGEEEKKEEEEQEGQNPPAEQTPVPPEEVVDPPEGGTDPGENDTETGGDSEEGDNTGDTGNTEGSGSPSGGEGQTPGESEPAPGGNGEPAPSGGDGEPSGGNTQPTAPPAEPTTPPEGDGDGSDGDTLTARALRDGWQLLVEEDQGPGEDDPETGSGSTGSYIMVGPADEEIHWEEYANLMSVKFVYQPNPTPGTMLYEVESVEEVISAPGLPLPLDVYSVGSNTEEESGGGNGGINLLNGSGTRTIAGGAMYEYVGQGKGSWKLTYDPKGTTEIMIKGAPIYIRCRTNDWLKQYVFSSLSDGDNADSDFQIEVITKTAGEVIASDVQNADLIFLESGETNTVLTGSVTRRYISKTPETSDSDLPLDMSEAAVSQILREAAEDLKPVIVDYGIVEDTEHYADFNYQYLAKALLKRNLAEFIEAMDDKGNLLENVKLNVKDSDDFPVKDDNKYNYVNQNVYVVSGDALVSDSFPERFGDDEERAGFSDVLSAIRAENTTLSEDDRISERVSPARAVQYIINFSVGILGDFSNLAILEIQPSANLKSDFTLEDENTKLLWKKDGMRTAKQILFSKNEIQPPQIDTKSVVEFNSEWEDINGVYDMVFIGLDGQRLNQNDEGETRYNKEELNGRVYHLGDESGVGTYDANDLTTQKMDALLHYMAAGYPVLVENDCFEGGSAQRADGDDVNTDYIQENTVMYRFLQTAVSDERYEDCIFTVADAMASSMFMTRVRLGKPRIALVDEDGEETSPVQILSRDENDEYHGQIYYKITDNHGDDYGGDAVINVYADFNHDGYFTPAEQVTEYINQDNMLDVEIDGMGPGILPWKIEVSDVGNEYRRASVQGYFELSSETADELKVLQITEKKNNPSVDLQMILNQEKTSSLSHYLKDAEKMLNVEWQIESVDAAQLETKLGENENYLSQWDVVVLTLDGAAENAAVTEAVNRYVGEGRSLLVCGQDPGDQRAGLSAELLGQTESKTFVNLGAGGASGYQRYDGLNGDMYSPQAFLQAEPVNEGSISLYPFVIDGKFTFGGDGFLRAAPYLLDFEDNLVSEENTAYVTPWYTFSSDDWEGTAYGISPRDGRNNYYCYSKSNVVYLAQSEYAYTCDEEKGPEPDKFGSAECQFFVNALMAAYSAGLHNAHINIVAGFSPDAADIASISVPFDETWLETSDSSGGILGNTVDVYFKFRDSNLAPEKTSLIGFYYEDPSAGEVDLGTQKVNATPFASEIWTVTDNKLVKLGEDEELQPGKIYRIKAPVVALRDSASLTRDESRQEEANKADIYIVLQTSFTRSGRNYQIISADAVSLNRTRLFLLE